MRVLTLEEEKNVIQHGLGELIDNGAARAVYEITAELADYLQIPHRAVIKVAVGVGGYHQTQVEIETFAKYGRNYLAEIYAHGRFVEIMERVDADSDDYRDFADSCGDVLDYMEYNLDKSDYTDEEWQHIYEDYDEAFHVISFLEDELGCTSDNGQLGRASDGRLVAYDYGFVSGNGCDGQTSDLTDYIGDDKFDEYLTQLVDLLDAEESVLSHAENMILYNENGDGTYTRYEVSRLRTYMAKPYVSVNHFCSLESAKQYIINLQESSNNIEHNYRISRIVRDVDGNELSHELIEDTVTDENKALFDEKGCDE